MHINYRYWGRKKANSRFIEVQPNLNLRPLSSNSISSLNFHILKAFKQNLETLQLDWQTPMGTYKYFKRQVTLKHPSNTSHLIHAKWYLILRFFFSLSDTSHLISPCKGLQEMIIISLGDTNTWSPLTKVYKKW